MAKKNEEERLPVYYSVFSGSFLNPFVPCYESLSILLVFRFKRGGRGLQLASLKTLFPFNACLLSLPFAGLRKRFATRRRSSRTAKGIVLRRNRETDDFNL
ncbi:hypothetical protein CEXT_189101 [Caerostris extrusa]|uniref:Transmembrane protein n=1 Tax=Caerostris extrusa TaxID=172846 RepID=A0AAV4P8K6_CAEEX|nr:hypothetical protein CEXT_189101 [Caerostris extrusa]